MNENYQLPKTKMLKQQNNTLILITILLWSCVSVFASEDTSPQYHYHITDHQGNIRLVANAAGTAEQVTHYYPYGLPFADGTNANHQPYKYNGKELDTKDNLNLYDYGARHYDAALCRWTSQDALTEKYYNVSPYNYCVGNPITFVDPDGNSVHWVESKTGNIYWDDNAISESTTKAGEKYLGREGYGINEITGDAIHYGANGVATEAPIGIGDITVSGDKGISAVRQSVYQSQRDFLTHPVTQAAINTMLFVATGGVEGVVSLSGLGAKFSSTTTVGRVFWSGGGNPAVLETAKIFATQNGMTTLEMTTKGKLLTALTNATSYNFTKPLWQKASISFAKGAQGTVHVFHNTGGINVKSIWGTIEYPILKNKGTNIIYHNVP